MKTITILVAALALHGCAVYGPIEAGYQPIYVPQDYYAAPGVPRYNYYVLPPNGYYRPYYRPAPYVYPAPHQQNNYYYYNKPQPRSLPPK